VAQAGKKVWQLGDETRLLRNILGTAYHSDNQQAGSPVEESWQFKALHTKHHHYSWTALQTGNSSRAQNTPAHPPLAPCLYAATGKTEQSKG